MAEMAAKAMKGSTTHLAMAIAAGIAGSAVVMLAPVALLERAIGATGLSAVLPAAAPPLGDTARMLLAFTLGVIAMAAVALSGPDGRRFIAALRKGKGQAPVRRRADFHPDAPARAPLMASTDLAEPAFVPVVEMEESEAPEEEEILTPSPAFSRLMERSKAIEATPEMPLIAEKPMTFAAPEVEYVPVEPVVEAETVIEMPPVADEPLSDIAIPQLVSRFENGLRRRIALRESYAAARRAREALAEVGPAAAVTRPAAADVEDALQEALGTLQALTRRAG